MKSQDQKISPELRQAIAEAATWYSRLSDVDVRASLQNDFEHWLMQSEIHRQGWHQIQRLQQRTQQIPAGLAKPILENAEQARRRFVKGLLGLAVLAPVGVMIYRNQSWQNFDGELLVSQSERQHHILLDGSLLVLDINTQVSVAFSGEERLINLLKGQILIDTAHQNTDFTQPLRVATRHGIIEALGTRFSVLSASKLTRVMLHEKNVLVASQQGQIEMLKAGYQLTLDAEHISKQRFSYPMADEWIHGRLVAMDMPLGELLTELARYSSAYISCDDSIAHLKVSGAFQLDNISLAMQTLERAFPVEIKQLTPYWIRLSSADI